MNNIIIGGVSSIIAITATAPLELYKIQSQNSYIKGSTIRNVFKKEGLVYLWKGNGVNCIRAFPQISLNFAGFQYFKTHNFLNIENETFKHFIAGGISGIISKACIYPLETVRTRLSLQMNYSHYSTIYDSLKKMPSRQLYGGLRMSLIGYGSFNALNFAFFNYYKNYLIGTLEYDPTIGKLLGGGLSSVSAATITYPTDLIRKRLQMQGFSSTVPKYTGIIDCIRKMSQKGGKKALYKGLIPTYMKLFPCFAIQFWCFEKGKQLIAI